MTGWIKLHRKLLDNGIITKPELLQLFIYCLLKANHEDKQIIFNGSETTIYKGEFITGREVMAKELKQKGRTLYDRLKILEKLKIISCKSNNKFSVVTVVNYELYQSVKEEPNSNTNNQPTTSQQPANTNKNYKNYKNEKKKDIYTEIFEKAYKIYPRSQAKQDTFNNWDKLLKTYTEEQLFQFTLNYAEFYGSIPENDRGYAYSSNNFFGQKAYYKDFTEPKKWEGKQTSSLSVTKKKPSQMGNFTQRKHSEEYYESLYENIESGENGEC